MKLKIKITIALLYITAYSNFIFELIGFGFFLTSYIQLIVDIFIIFIGSYIINIKKINIGVLICIIILTFFNYLSHNYSIISFFNGLRELVILLFIFSFYEQLIKTNFKNYFRNNFFIFVNIFLLVQIPITIYQFYQFGAGDKVGGTLGEGNSGVLTLVIIPFVYLCIKETQFKLKSFSYLYVFFLIPVFINETKISFLLVPLMFICLSNFKKVSNLMFSIGGGLIIFTALNLLYTDKGKVRDNPFQEIFNSEFLEKYLFSEAEYGNDIPRFTKIILASKILDSNNDHFWGVEVGAFKGGKVLAKSKFSSQYEWLLLGSRPYIFYLLITGGWTLLLLFLIFILNKLFYNKSENCDIPFIMLLFTLLIVILFYNDSFRSQFFVIVFSYFIIYAKGYFGFSNYRVIKSNSYWIQVRDK